MAASLTFIALVSIFMFGCMVGWVLEVFFRKFFSRSNPEHKWINPGFCAGPWLPLYGCGICVLALLTTLSELIPFDNVVVGYIIKILVMGCCMTVVEYIAGLLLLNVYHMRLWDYRGIKGNINGLICPLFSFFWLLLSAAYIFLIHPYVVDIATFMLNNLVCCFPLGMLFGIFLVDLIHSLDLITKLKNLAAENQITVRFEELKIQAAQKTEHPARQRWLFQNNLGESSIKEGFAEIKTSAEQSIEQSRVQRQQRSEQRHEQAEQRRDERRMKAEQQEEQFRRWFEEMQEKTKR